MSAKLETYVAPAQTYIMHWDGSAAGAKEITAVLQVVLPMRDVQLDSANIRGRVSNRAVVTSAGPTLIIRAHNRRTGASLRCDLAAARYLGVIMDSQRVVAIADLGENIQVPIDVITVESSVGDGILRLPEAGA